MSARRVVAKTAARGVKPRASVITHAKSRLTRSMRLTRSIVAGGAKTVTKLSIRG
jgi:hypothetical protein